MSIDPAHGSRPRLSPRCVRARVAGQVVARSVAFLRGGLAAGEGDRRRRRGGLAVMREALGPDAERVAFCDVGSFCTPRAHARGLPPDLSRAAADVRGSFTVAESNSAHARGLGGVRRRTSDDERLVFAPPGMGGVRLRRERPSRPGVEDGGRPHAEMLTDGWHESGRFQEPRGSCGTSRPSRDRWRTYVGTRAAATTSTSSACCSRASWSRKGARAKVLDVLVAGTEIAANTVRYGGGITEVRLGRVDGRFVCEVVDRGQGFDDPLAGYLVPATESAPVSGLLVSSRGGSSSSTRHKVSPPGSGHDAIRPRPRHPGDLRRCRCRPTHGLRLTSRPRRRREQACCAGSGTDTSRTAS